MRLIWPQPFTAPASGTVGQSISITDQIDNESSAAASPSWFDSFYLSPQPAMSSSAVLIGRVEQTAGVADNSSYDATLHAAIPPVAPGNYYVVVIADSQGLVPDTNRGNDTAVSTTSILIGVPSLAANGSVTGTIAVGQALCTEPPPLTGAEYGEDLRKFQSRPVSPSCTSSISNRPTSSTFDQEAFVPTQTSQTITMDDTQAGTYYILVQGSSLAGAARLFTLSDKQLGFTISASARVELTQEITFT